MHRSILIISTKLNNLVSFFIVYLRSNTLVQLVRTILITFLIIHGIHLIYKISILVIFYSSKSSQSIHILIILERIWLFINTQQYIKNIAFHMQSSPSRFSAKGSLYLFSSNYFAAFAFSHRAVKAAGSWIAVSDSILRFMSIPASFRPCMKVE